MFDPYKLRKDFPMFTNNKELNGHPLAYLDNAATTFKPQCVINAVNEYYSKYTANAHRGDYEFSFQTDKHYENARKTVAKFINAESNEIAFTSGTSMSINMIAYGLENFLQEGDEILITEAEHASNVLPWFNVSKRTGAKIKYVPLTNDGRVTSDNLIKVISNRTKVVSIAQVSNVLAYAVDIKTLVEISHKFGAYFICDGAQSIAHMKVDVKDLDVDFFAFSGHKIYGPTGIGVLYGKFDLLKKMEPLLSGGGMTTRFDTCGDLTYHLPPFKFEAGTQNIAGAIGMAKAIEYLESLGMENVETHEKELRNYAISKLSEVSNLTIYNKNAEHAIIAINLEGINPQDLATYCNSKGICVRSGQHCAKILLDFLKTESTLRASFAVYNTKEDIDQLVDALKTGDNFLDAYFG